MAQKKLIKIQVSEADKPHEAINRVQEHLLSVLNPALKQLAALVAAQSGSK